MFLFCSFVASLSFGASFILGSRISSSFANHWVLGLQGRQLHILSRLRVLHHLSKLWGIQLVQDALATQNTAALQEAQEVHEKTDRWWFWIQPPKLKRMGFRRTKRKGMVQKWGVPRFPVYSFLTKACQLLKNTAKNFISDMNLIAWHLGHCTLPPVFNRVNQLKGQQYQRARIIAAIVPNT